MKKLKLFEEYSNGYPTIEEVESANPNQIMSWYRFLPSPSGGEQVEVMNRICDIWKELKTKGDINSNTSKSVGWNESLDIPISELETIMTGIISKNMGTVNQGLCINAAKEILEYIKKMSIEQFKDIKNL